MEWQFSDDVKIRKNYYVKIMECYNYYNFGLFQVMFKIAEKIKNFACIYLVDISEVPVFNKMYELYDPCTVMFFFRNKHIMIDLGWSWIGTSKEK